MCGRACRGTCAAAGGVKVLAGEGGGEVRKRARGDAGARVRAGAWECTRARVPCALACLSAPPRGRLVGRHRLCAFWLVAEPTPRPRPPGGGGFFIFSLVLLPWWISMFWAAFFLVGDFLSAAGFAPCAPQKSTTSTKRPPRTNANTAANEFFFKNPPGGEKRSSFGPVIGQAPP